MLKALAITFCVIGIFAPFISEYVLMFKHGGYVPRGSYKISKVGLGAFFFLIALGFILGIIAKLNDG